MTYRASPHTPGDVLRDGLVFCTVHPGNGDARALHFQAEAIAEAMNRLVQRQEWARISK